MAPFIRKANYDALSLFSESFNYFKEKDVRSILRVKALIAYYKGMLPSVIAQCYEINEKTLKNWIERFENEEPLDDLPRSGRPSKLPKESRKNCAR